MNDSDKDTQNIKLSPNIFEQLKIANNLKMHQDQLSWMIFSMFWATNALLLVALFQNSNNPFTSIKWIVISLVGISLSIIWFIILFRALILLSFYENLIGRLEDTCEITKEFQTGWDNPYYKKNIRGIKSKLMMKLIPILGITAWIIGLFFGISLNFQC